VTVQNIYKKTNDPKPCSLTFRLFWCRIFVYEYWKGNYKNRSQSQFFFLVIHFNKRQKSEL